MNALHDSMEAPMLWNKTLTRDTVTAEFRSLVADGIRPGTAYTQVDDQLIEIGANLRAEDLSDRTVEELREWWANVDYRTILAPVVTRRWSNPWRGNPGKFIVAVDFQDGQGPTDVLVFDTHHFPDDKAGRWSDKAVRCLQGKDEAGIRAELARIRSVLA